MGVEGTIKLSEHHDFRDIWLHVQVVVERGVESGNVEYVEWDLVLGAIIAQVSNSIEIIFFQ